MRRSPSLSPSLPQLAASSTCVRLFGVCSQSSSLASQVLLNRSVLLPSDPWLDTSPSSSPAPVVAPSPNDGTGSYTPELVAFLVRAGIVVQHPVERHKVRLEDFVGLAGGGS